MIEEGGGLVMGVCMCVRVCVCVWEAAFDEGIESLLASSVAGLMVFGVGNGCRIELVA